MYSIHGYICFRVNKRETIYKGHLCSLQNIDRLFLPSFLKYEGLPFMMDGKDLHKLFAHALNFSSTELRAGFLARPWAVLVPTNSSFPGDQASLFGSYSQQPCEGSADN